MSRFHLAEINIAMARAPLTAAIMQGFVAQLEAVNALAEAAPGFVWRLQSDSGNATDIRLYDDERIIVNMSVWETVDALFAYTYSGDHVTAFRRRTDWFERMEMPHLTLWWIAAGTLPTALEGKARLDHLRLHGPTAAAFTFKQRFPMPPPTER
jgi:Domain of unknown function (DUF3291)